jgi:Flp pilus assembly protein TadB
VARLEVLLVVAATWVACGGVLYLGRLGPPATVDPQEPPWPTLTPGGALDEAIPGAAALRRLQAAAGLRVSVLLLFVVAALGAGAAFELARDALLEPLELVAAVVGALAAPLELLRQEGDRRARALAAGLPAGLRAMGRLAAEGYAAPAAMGITARELEGPLAQELARVHAEQQAGQPFPTAVRAMADRSPGCVDLRLLVTALLLSEESEGDLAGLLGRLERTLSDRLAKARDAHAQTTQARLQGAILVALVPAAAGLIYLVAPEYLTSAWDDPTGRVLYTGAACWAAIGVLAIGLLLRSRP